MLKRSKKEYQLLEYKLYDTSMSMNHIWFITVSSYNVICVACRFIPEINDTWLISSPRPGLNWPTFLHWSGSNHEIESIEQFKQEMLNTDSPHLWMVWFMIIFGFLMVLKWYIFSRKYTSNFEFWFFPD